jgi:starch synthase
VAGLRVLLAASEVVGFAKTGGLADVAGALPRALAARGHQVAVVMPYYRAVRYGKHKVESTGQVIPVPLAGRVLACRVHKSKLPGSDVPIYFVEAPEYFDRDDTYQGKSLYQQNMPGGYKADYPDNAERFTFFSRAVLETASVIGFLPDIIHANDWQTGLVPAFLSELYRQKPGWNRVRSVYTVHNIAYQGMFPADVLKLTGLPGWTFNPKQLEFHGMLNFMKSGIVFADAVNTVSPTYAREIQTAEYGCGLEGLLWENRRKLSGIVNGVDYDEWDPIHDQHIPVQYGIRDVFDRKPVNKAELQKRFKLPDAPDRPVLGMVARLVSQKGVDLVLSAAPGFLDMGCQMVFLGDGDPEYHNELTQFRERYPEKVGVYLGFNESLAHLVEAGSDLFLMPSRYEPSGLNQLYSLKYGTPPVVRATGGLADTIVNATEENLKADVATGFAFGDYSARALYETVKWALHLYRDREEDFQKVVRCAMRQDWSWARSAAAYEELYRKLLAT